MKINLSLKYWGKHKLRAFSIIFAIAVSMAAMTCATFLARSSSVAFFEIGRDAIGDFDLLLANTSEENLERYQFDERFSETGILYRGGTAASSGAAEYIFGALSENAESLYYFTPEAGRYPQKSGEITATRTFLEANGCAAEVGNRITLVLRDFDGNIVGEREFTIVGVLWDQRDGRTIERAYRFPNREEFVFPQVFLWHGDLQENISRSLMVQCTMSADLESVRSELNENEIDYFFNNRMTHWNAITFSLPYGDSEEDLYNSLKYAHKDFYARTLIPIFTAVVMITAFVSISSVMSTSLSERKRQLAMLRCIGMEKRKGLLMALGESLVMVAIGIAAGFLVGIGAYLLALFIQKELLGIHVYYAFTVHPVIAATTADPYILPAAACFITGFLATLIPYLIELNKSPVEGLHENRSSKRKIGFRVKGKTAVLGKISGGFRQNISFLIIVTVVIWAAVFGYSFFAAHTEIRTRAQRDKIDTELMGLDYLAQRSEFYALGNAQLNRHNLGLSPESVAKISENNDVETSFAAIEAKSTKAVYNSETVDEEIANALSSTNSYNQVLIGDMEQLIATMSAQGYLENEALYNIPTLGVSSETLDMLSEFIIEGNYNKEKLLSGEEILILNTSRNSPYSVGDIIPMTDIVIDDPIAEEFDFSYGAIPENAVPSFYYVFPDDPTGYEWPCYAFGTRRDYSVTVGGIVNITDENISSFFQTDGLVGNCGFNILCADSAFEKWGLPDRNPTKLGVKLSKNANLADFEKLWFSVIGSSSKVGSSSVTAIRRSLNTIERSNMSIFAAVIITVVILGLVGIVNSVNLRVRRGLRSYSTLRAVGLPKKGLIALIMRQGLICAVMGAITSLIPLGVYEAFRRTAHEFVLNDGIMIGFDANGRYDIKWQQDFPFHIEIWKQPIFLIILAVLAAVCAVILISNMIPARWIAKKNITEALRNDDF